MELVRNNLCFDIGGYQNDLEPLGFEGIPEYLNILKQGVDENRKAGQWNVDPNLNISAWKPTEPGSQVIST